MQIKCSGCGAPLEVAASAATVKCRYCGATSYPGAQTTASGSAPGRSAPGRSASRRRVLLVALPLAAIAIGGAYLFLFTPAPVTEALQPVRVSPAPAPVAPPIAAPAAPAAPRTVPPAPRVTPLARPPVAAPAPTAASTVDLVSNADARKVLEPALLECMREHGVHYLITRLGQGYQQAATGPLGPLIEVDTSIVDYRPSPDFSASPLGVCVLRAASGVNTRALRGAYLYFGLRNAAVPDPLADAPARLDAAAATAALETADPQARECARRHPDEASPGATISVHVTFTGVDGAVVDVKPFYLATDSAYGRCLVAAYAQVQAGRFRDLTAKVVHRLSP